jgi:hypothetical protein
LRNPWRLHIDPQSGDLWVGNNGQDLWESLYRIERGANYGWSLVEGTHPFYPQRKQGPTPISKPIVEHSHSEARSLTGGRVYHGTKFPELQGAYLYGDWSTGKIWGVRDTAGKVTWQRELADTSLQITAFGTDSRGELLIVDYGGGLYELERTPAETAPAKFPTRLSATGLFASVRDHRPDPALIPYSVNAPLWSDGAVKERFIALPGTAPIDFTGSRGWDFPEGAVLVKTFSLPRDETDAKSLRRIETRLLTKQQGKWVGYSYAWDDAQSDATLVGKEGRDQEIAIRSRDGARKQLWHYPSRAECVVCHSRAANFVLGLNVLQMNRDHDYHGVIDNQLRSLEHIGALRVSTLEQFRHLQEMSSAAAGLATLIRAIPGEKALESELEGLEERLRAEPTYETTLPRRPERYPRLVDPYDTKADLNQRARSYLHANCAGCHVTAGGGNALMDLEFTTPAARMRLFDVPPQHQDFGIKEARLVAPGKPDQSVLYQRLARRGLGQMPPLATREVDTRAVQLMQEWIKQLSR